MLLSSILLNNKILSKSNTSRERSISVFDFKKNSKNPKSEYKAGTIPLAEQLKLTRTSLFGTLFTKKKSTIDDNIINELEDRFC